MLFLLAKKLGCASSPSETPSTHTPHEHGSVGSGRCAGQRLANARSFDAHQCGGVSVPYSRVSLFTSKGHQMKTKATRSTQMDIGITEANRKKIAQGLSGLLADSYTLYLMTHNFHWNVTGPQFNSLHNMFMQQYTEQWAALDLIAERIRALGFAAPGTYKEFVKLASIKEVDGVPKANDMVRHLVAAQEAVARTARKMFPVVDAANDQPTADVLTQRIDVHEKTAWMLRSLLEE